MNGRIPAAQAIPALLSTQLMAAEIYSSFLYSSNEGECHLWQRLLAEELEHVENLKKALYSPLPSKLTFPYINVPKMREACAEIATLGTDRFLLRLEGALRLECAELDYGLEGLVARKMERSEVISGYPVDISNHLTNLLTEASRYSESSNIGRQIRRLMELFETALHANPLTLNHDGTRRSH